MRSISNESKVGTVTKVSGGWVTVAVGDDEEHLPSGDIRNCLDPQVGDQIRLTYHSNGDIHGKWIGHKEQPR